VVSSKKDLQIALELSDENIAYGNFYDAIHTLATRRSYTYGLKNFMKFLVEKGHLKHDDDYTILAGFDAGTATDLIKLHIKVLKKRVKPPSVNAYVAGIFLFFDMNRVSLFKKEINRSKDKNNQTQSGHTPVTTVELQNMISICNHPRDIATILFLTSTGMRPGGFNDPILRMKHLTIMNTPTDEKCYALKVYDESRELHWVFLTPESTKALDKYFAWRKSTRHEEFTDESPIFTAVSLMSSFSNMTMDSLYHLLGKIYAKSSLVRTKQGVRYDKAITYMYRIRFNTILKLNNALNSNIAEKLMAHKKGLDGSYLQPTKEECFVEFVKAIPELTVDSSRRKQLELDEVNKEKSDLENVNLVLKQTVKEKDELAKKYHDMQISQTSDEKIIKTVEEFLKTKNIFKNN
jgi:integrase/recombinase XerD